MCADRADVIISRSHFDLAEGFVRHCHCAGESRPLVNINFQGICTWREVKHAEIERYRVDLHLTDNSRSRGFIEGEGRENSALLNWNSSNLHSAESTASGIEIEPFS